MFDSFNEQEKLLAMKAQYALTHNEYEVYFQPKLNLRKKEIESCEALIRWNSPEFGFLSPISFLYVFEKTAVISFFNCIFYINFSNH